MDWNYQRANGVVGFSVAVNSSGSSRSGQITVLGQPVTIAQNGPYSLSTYSRLEVPNGGYDSVIVVVASGFPSWSSSSNASWLHVVSGSGTGGGAATFFIDYNSGATRTGTLTIAGETLTIVQAGNTYVQTSTVADIVDSGVGQAQGVAVDAAGNVYIANTYAYDVLKWSPITGSPTTLESDLFAYGVAVDVAGDVYVADDFSDGIEEWTPSYPYPNFLVGGFSQPQGVAVDMTGNVFIADTGDDAVAETPYAFVDPTPINEGSAAGSDSLPVILPYTVNLNGPFTPTSDSPWLTVNTPANGVVSFSFTANAGSDRTGNLTVLGQTIPVTQAGSGPASPTLTGPTLLAPGVLQFTFTGAPGTSFTVLSTTNLTSPLSKWTVEGPVTTSFTRGLPIQLIGHDERPATLLRHSLAVMH